MRTEKWYLAFRFVNNAKGHGFSFGNSWYNQIEEREIPLEAKTRETALEEVAKKNLDIPWFVTSNPRLICRITDQIIIGKLTKKRRFG